MGDFSSSDCSWKKIVIAKANNEWISTIKKEHSELDNNVASESPHEQINLQKVKRENVDYMHAVIDDTEQSTEDTDPLSTLEPLEPVVSIQIPDKRRCRKGSAPKNESPDERAVRLAKMSAYAAQRLANETSEQRATRLRRMSEYAARRLAHETSDQRAKRLARMSAYAAKRLASETPEQRQARLTRMSAYAAKRQAMKKVASTSEDVHSDFNFTNVMHDQS